MKKELLLVGGNFDRSGGRPSKLVAVMAANLEKEGYGVKCIKQAMMANIPNKRFGKPEDVGAAAFLASDEADYVNGATLYVDGGWLAS